MATGQVASGRQDIPKVAILIHLSTGSPHEWLVLINNRPSIFPLLDKDNTSDRGSGSHEGVLVILTWDEAAVRRAFIRRVFALLTVMLLIVSGMGSVTIFSQVVRDYLSEKWWISLIAWIPFLIVYFVLICFAGARRSFPCNFILLMILVCSSLSNIMCIRLFQWELS